jgi:ABC-2 type transport system permease protein
MLRAALALEWALLWRDRAVLAALGLLVIILTISVLAGASSDRAEAEALRSAAERVQAEWAAQPPKNPHDAAHYGILVYRPAGPLQALEAGVLPYQGAVIALEAHRRNAPILSPASVRNADSRYGGTRFSPLLQLAGGFLSLLVGYLVGAREARRGVLALALGVGARGRPLVIAKTLVVLIAVTAATAPAFALAYTGVSTADAAARLSALLGASLVHLFILAGLGVAAGAVWGRSRAALAVVALAWALSAVVAPRALDVVAERVVPLRQSTLSATIATDFAKGPDGHGDSEANAVFEREILERYGVERAEDLPVNFDALLMQADEVYRGGVYDRRLAEADAQRQRQDAIRALAWALGPTPAMLDLSVRLASADPSAQRRFDEAAEGFRRAFVERLNLHMAENSRTGDWGWTPADGYYASFESFKPPQPRLSDDLPGARPSALALLVWLALTMGALAASARVLERRARG